MIVQEVQKVYVLDPTTEPLGGTKAAAPRLDSLDGKSVGLLSNGKINATPILKLMGEILAEKYELKEVVTIDKGLHLGPTPLEIIEEVAGRCDAVLVGVGD